ncbi:hypothetical protein RFN28_18880 [Mesorhizobium sp. VK24D]|uniref:Uncharacterized protein n=1 Tax=Mesorhizobium album TaxID=3072314 RepID=A0ABU4Y0N4_9HYPH|nr:hypothetical protein [Mesorhizobium sp. VK24D]MDX8480510.1 hypothetical protein [Mesorhizobium sp. VK24D]
MRFVAVQDPTGSWTVFDTANEEPAELAGRVLIGLTPHEALWLTAAANDEEAGCRETHALGLHPRQ